MNADERRSKHAVKTCVNPRLSASLFAMALVLSSLAASQSRVSILGAPLLMLSVLRLPGQYLSPQALVASNDGSVLYVAEFTARQIAVFDTRLARVTRTIPVPSDPTGLALSGDGRRLYVTCAAGAGAVQVVDTATGRIVRTIAAGAGATSPVLDPRGNRLYVCNRFDNSLSVIELAGSRETARIPLSREPYAAAISPDGRLVLVAAHLPEGPATAESVAAKISIIDTGSNKLSGQIELPNGSTSVRGLAVSPDGSYAYATHILARYTVHTAQLEQGWMNTNALSVIDVRNRKLLNTALLDDVDSGAANPWGVACTRDSKYVCVVHAGTHELSIIDASALLEKLSQRRGEDASNELSFLNEIRTRVGLGGKGPRGLAITGSAIFVAEYFTDTLARVGLADRRAASFPLGPRQDVTPQRRGEILFHDAMPCFQHWQSCSSCHPGGRADGLNWDLLNDGIGNPKNTRSLLFAHRNPPVMATGVRRTAEQAVRSGMEFIQFAEPREGDAAAIDEYLKSLKPAPSPFLVDGKLSKAAERGKDLFFSKETGCASCHRLPFYTDGELHDVGSHSRFDFTVDAEGRRVPQKQFKTPVLVEVWRTAPYFHDGRYATVKEAIAKGACGASRGGASRLTEGRLNDLVEFVLSL